MEEAVTAELLGEGGQAEIGKLEVALFIKEYVLGLDVAVSYSILVTEDEGRDELPEEAARGGF